MGRRSQPRFSVVNPWEGTMRVLRDVVVDRNGDSDLYAVSVAPGVVGEEMSLELITGVSRRSLRVRVVDSRPVIIGGGVQHRVQLVVLDALQPAAGRPLTNVGEVRPTNVVEPA
jgi:hypothetical protein